MATKARSRWADEEEDAEFAAKLRREKEERKRSKAARARQLEEERQAKANKLATGRTTTTLNLPEQRPVKRRKVTPEPDADAEASASGGTRGDRTLLRLGGGHWGKCRSVEHFDKLNDIEEGTYGWVARARELATGNIVALKRLKIDKNDRNGLPVTGLREIQVLKDCSHRNIVHMKEVVVGETSAETDRSIFLVLEFIEHDLRSLLEDMPDPFLPSEVKRLLLQLGAGLAYLHDNWILHRDLKTSNLLLSNRGELKIADFGMARYVGDPPPKLTQLVVTLWYRAPEILLGTQTYGQAVDMWSVGCIFAELIDRKPILQGSNEVDQVSKIFELCGVPSEESWPGFRRLPNARQLRLPQVSQATGSVIRAKFSTITNAARSLLGDLLSLNPERRPSAKQMLQHEYFQQDPKPKQESMFPTFPSKAGQERRRRHEPNAPIRGQAVDLGEADFTGIFHSREKEERGGGFALRMV